MPNPVVGMVGGSMVTGIMGSNAQKSAARTAASAQQAATQMGVDEQRRQFNISRKVLEPYVQAGVYGLYGLPPEGITPQQAYSGTGFGGAPVPQQTAAERLGIDPSTLPDPVPFAQMPAGERPTNFGGRGGMNAVKRIQAYDNQVKAFQDYQNYTTELGRLGISPGVADAIRLSDQERYRREVDGSEFGYDPAEGTGVDPVASAVTTAAQQAPSLVAGTTQREKPGLPTATAGDPATTGAAGGTYQPGGLFGYAQTGQEALPILQGYAQTGADALEGQRALAGLGGIDAQRAAIEGLRGTPEYEMLVKEGEEALLQNAAATGGVRGGRTTEALMEYRPQILTDLINRQYSRLGGLAGQGGTVASQLGSMGQSAFSNIAGMGQASAAGQASGALQTGANIANLTQAGGTAQANAALASGAARANMWNNVGNTIGQIGALKMMGAF